MTVKHETPGKAKLKAASSEHSGEPAGQECKDVRGRRGAGAGAPLLWNARTSDLS